MRASCFALAAFVVWGAAGCGATPKPPDGSAPPAEVLYLVHNEIWRIGADGTGAARLATVGDDGYRTAFPRRLADGQLALLADDTGAIYPYLVSQGQIHTVGATNVTIHDSIAAATIGGAAALVYTVTPYVGGRAALMRANPAGSDVQGVALELGGVLSDPSPWDDGSVLVVRSARGQVTIEILDIAGGNTREVLATVDAPYSAHAPARLPDGRVVFVRTDPRDSTDTAIGELFVLDRGGVARTTGITGVLALVVVGNDIVYEAGGADGVTDLIRTNLVDPPVNLTRTPTVAEHLGWSDSSH
ncbi:MAG TPA: hypothetical protein VN947_34685 [Polyangia bacterium]|nr:hypothetical protein [Polyangia bacterium]